jgi:hypothetical protein
MQPTGRRGPAVDLPMTELNGTEVFQRKSPEWSYEQEWRMLAPVSFASIMVA